MHRLTNCFTFWQYDSFHAYNTYSKVDVRISWHSFRHWLSLSISRFSLRLTLSISPPPSLSLYSYLCVSPFLCQPHSLFLFPIYFAHYLGLPSSSIVAQMHFWLSLSSIEKTNYTLVIQSLIATSMHGDAKWLRSTFMHGIKLTSASNIARATCFLISTVSNVFLFSAFCCCFCCCLCLCPCVSNNTNRFASIQCVCICYGKVAPGFCKRTSPFTQTEWLYLLEFLF